jgi:hypothetical protein
MAFEHFQHRSHMRDGMRAGLYDLPWLNGKCQCHKMRGMVHKINREGTREHHYQCTLRMTMALW